MKIKLQAHRESAYAPREDGEPYVNDKVLEFIDLAVDVARRLGMNMLEIHQGCKALQAVALAQMSVNAAGTQAVAAALDREWAASDAGSAHIASMFAEGEQAC